MTYPKQPSGSDGLATSDVRLVANIVPLLTQSGTIDEKLRSVAKVIAERANYLAVDVMVLEGENLEFVRHNQFSLVEEGVAQAWENEVQSRGALTAFTLFENSPEPLVIDYAQSDARSSDMERRMSILAGIGSALVVPLIWDETLHGALAVTSEQVEAFAGTADFFMTVATEVSALLAQGQMVTKLQAANDALGQMYDDTVMMLATVAEAYDETTGEHLKGVRRVTELLASDLGFDAKSARQLGLASVLHDLGKVRLPREILAKPSALTCEERRTMEHHTVWGEALLRDRVGFDLAATVARSHHERWDGTGYPDGLREEQIPVEVAIVSVADAFDAMIRRRPYKPGYPQERAVGEILTCEATQFDPRVVRALIRLDSAGLLRNERTP